MSELVGRFLSFEDHLGRGLVKFVYYVLLFLLIITTFFELVTALIGMFGGPFWPNLWAFLVLVPLSFLVKLLLLRVGAELVMAILSIDDNLRSENGADTISSGLNPVTPSRAEPTLTPMRIEPEPSSTEEEEDEDTDVEASEPKLPVRRKQPAKKRAAKKAVRKQPAKKASATPSEGGDAGEDTSSETDKDS